MIAVITGDIINSRALSDQQAWLKPLKALLEEWGPTPGTWEIYRGDSFQVGITDPLTALSAAMRIKAVVRSVPPDEDDKRVASIDVRMAIGIGEKDSDAPRISECNGSAFVNSGEQFEKSKREKVNLAVRSPWPEFDQEINLYLRLALIAMNSWSITSGELMNTLLKHPHLSQQEIAAMLNIEQNSASGRYKRAHVEEMLLMESAFREKLSQRLS
ncbi:MAG TPA: hypothetical protein VKZ86_13260 [Cyclobacteriaceae bacterium]|nr:hypothetical protein [Cyclobacteriaceae bacterium]